MKLLFQEKTFDNLNHPTEIRVVIANGDVIVQERDFAGEWSLCEDDEITIRALQHALLEANT